MSNKKINIPKTYIISVIILRIDEKNNITDLVSEVKYLNFIIELVFDGLQNLKIDIFYKV